MTPLLVVMDQMYGSGRGGTERQVLRLLALLQKHDIDPHMLFLRRDPWHAEAGFDFPWQEVGIGGLLPAGIIGAALRVTREMKRIRAFAAMSFFDDALLVTASACGARRDVRFIATQRNMGTERGMFMRRAVAIAFRSADAVVVNSTPIRDSLVYQDVMLENKIHVIPNLPPDGACETVGECSAVETAVAAFRERGMAIAAIVANLRPVKGVQDAISALAMEPARIARVGLIVCGHGPMRSELEQLARRLEVSDRVAFVGNIENVSACLRHFDFGVLPSHAEGSANVGLEFAAASLPFIATRVGGNAELLDSSKAGLSVPVKDPAALSAAMRLMMDDSAQRSRLAENGRIYSESRPTASDIVDRYASILKGTSRSAVL